MAPSPRAPLLEGGLLACAAAIAFGVTTPLVQRFGAGVGPFTTASLLYAGAVLAAMRLGPRPEGETPLDRTRIVRVVAISIFGSVLAPASLAWGLQRTGGVTASLLLHLEAPFTVLLATLLYREHLGRRLLVALVAMFSGGVVLALAGTGAVRLGWAALAIPCAALGWAIDNTLTRPLADHDPRQVVAWKGIVGASLGAVVALLSREPMPSLIAGLALLACGATGYGLSLRFYLLAQRRIGVARTGSIFAVAPFVGALAAWVAGDRSVGAATGVAALLFAAGIVLHLGERHGHHHTHEPLEHEHAHRHDDGHHDHVHDPPFVGEHVHPHRHDATSHDHPHADDLHHRHRHG